MSYQPYLYLLTQTCFASALLMVSSWGVLETADTVSSQPRAPRGEHASTAIQTVTLNQRAVTAAGMEFMLGVRDGHLVFPNIQDYRNVVDDPDAATRESFLRATEELSDIQLLTHRGEGEMPLIEDAYFRSILNVDGIVEIGEYILKVVPTERQVLALPAADRGEYANLVAGDHSNPHLHAFNTDEDVLDQLEDARGGMMSPLLGCKETGIGGCDRYSGYKLIPSSNPLVNMRASVHYNKFGIYYSLFGLLEMGTTSNVEIKLDLEPVRYKPRCKSSVGPYNQYDYQSTANQHSNQRWQSYQGSTALNEVHIRVRGKAYVGGSTTAAATTDWVEYRKNI